MIGINILREENSLKLAGTISPNNLFLFIVLYLIWSVCDFFLVPVVYGHLA